MNWNPRLSSKFAALALASAACLASAPAMAAYTYVDADFTSNTGDTASFAGAVTSPDNLWGERAFGTNATVIESSGTGSGSEDSPEIFTTISGLDVGGLYSVYAHFYDVANDSGQNWPIQAGFTSGALTLYANGPDGGAAALSAAAAGPASDLTFVTDPKFDDGGNRILQAASLGVATANGAGEITVYIDDLPGGGSTNTRTWYDGVSYEAVPEPAAALLISSALSLVALRRRQRA